MAEWLWVGQKGGQGGCSIISEADEVERRAVQRWPGTVSCLWSLAFVLVSVRTVVCFTLGPLWEL